MTVFLPPLSPGPPIQPSFISKVEPQSRMYVMDKDLVTLEGQARGALSVLSNLGCPRHSGSAERFPGHAG